MSSSRTDAMSAMLRKQGFVEIDSARSESFGDRLAVWKSPGLHLRIVRDRGQVFVDLASPLVPETWWHLDAVQEALKLSSPNEPTGGDSLDQTAGLGEFLDRHGEGIRDAFSAERISETRAALEAIRRRSADRFRQEGESGPEPGGG